MTGVCAIAGRKCPRTNDPAEESFCPAFWKTIWTNDVGETKLVEGCAFTQLPDYITQMSKNTTNAAIAAQEARNVGEELKAETRQRHRSAMFLLAHLGGLKDVQSPRDADDHLLGRAGVSEGIEPKLPARGEGD